VRPALVPDGHQISDESCRKRGPTSDVSAVGIATLAGPPRGVGHVYLTVTSLLEAPRKARGAAWDSRLVFSPHPQTLHRKAAQRGFKGLALKGWRRVGLGRNFGEHRMGPPLPSPPTRSAKASLGPLFTSSAFFLLRRGAYPERALDPLHGAGIDAELFSDLADAASGSL
jgi:hypothetical protein